jgi:hypothetical protein
LQVLMVSCCGMSGSLGWWVWCWTAVGALCVDVQVFVMGLVGSALSGNCWLGSLSKLAVVSQALWGRIQHPYQAKVACNGTSFLLLGGVARHSQLLSMQSVL